MALSPQALAVLDQVEQKISNALGGNLAQTRNLLSNIGPEDTQMMDSIDGMLDKIVPEGIQDRGDVIEGLRDTLLERARDEMAPTQNVDANTNSVTTEQNGGTTVTTEINGHNAMTANILNNVGEQMGWDRQEVMDFTKDYRGNMSDAGFRNGEIRASFDGAVDNAFGSNGVIAGKNSVGMLNGMVNGMEENQAQALEAQSMESPAVNSSTTAPQAMDM